MLFRKNVKARLRIGDRRPVRVVDLRTPPSSHERISRCRRLTIDGHRNSKQPEKCNSDQSAHWSLLSVLDGQSLGKIAASGIRVKLGAAVACAVSRYVLLIRILSETARAYSSR